MTRASAMNDHRDNGPMACSLTTPELRHREATLLAQFKSAVMEKEELQDGFAFRLPGDAKSIALISDLIVAERECCPFLLKAMAEWLKRYGIRTMAMQSTGVGSERKRGEMQQDSTYARSCFA
jgi:hypothetical protein